MGDFDRNDDAPKKTSGKQWVMAAVLGTTLLGLMAYEFTGKGPQTASASSVRTADGSDASAVETPEQVLAALQNDPTQKLLLESHSADPIGATLLRNPFRISNPWRSALVSVQAPIAAPAPEVHLTARVEPTRVAAEGFKLTTIVNGQYAVINNKIVTVGAVVDKARVLEIRSDRVVLQSVDFPDGPRTELLLNAPLNK